MTVSLKKNLHHEKFFSWDTKMTYKIYLVLEINTSIKNSKFGSMIKFLWISRRRKFFIACIFEWTEFRYKASLLTHSLAFTSYPHGRNS